MAKTTTDIIKDFEAVHGNKYDYSKVIYTKMTEKVIVVCPEHGPWEIRAFAHKKGQGCMGCRGYCGPRKNTDEDIISKAREVHGNAYDYSKMVFKNILTKIEIVCPEHGSFFQTPDNHIRKGNKCPYCKNTGASRESKKVLTPIIRELQKRNIQFFFDSTEFRVDVGSGQTRYHLDLYVPSLNLNVEFNGSAWHPDFTQLTESEWNSWTVGNRGMMTASTKALRDNAKYRFLFNALHCVTWVITPNTRYYVDYIIDEIKKAP